MEFRSKNDYVAVNNLNIDGSSIQNDYVAVNNLNIDGISIQKWLRGSK